MSHYRKLLVLSSPGEAPDPALVLGSRLAKASGAELILRQFPGTEAARGQPHEANLTPPPGRSLHHDPETALEAKLQGLREQGLVVSGSVVRDEPLREAMLAAIIDTEPDLTLKTVHHQSALRRLFFTPDDSYLARLSPAPLLVVSGGPDRIPRHVLAAVDPSSEADSPSLDRRIIAAAAALASACEAELHLAYVSEPIAEIMADANMVGGVTTMGMAQQLEGDREAAFQAFADRVGIPPAARHFRRGRVDLELSELAQQLGACVIVVGSNYRSGMERFFLGSTTGDLLAIAEQDILVVKPEDFTDRLAETSGKLLS